MGRFYKATSGQFVDDKMFQIPFQEMAAVMGQTDKNIDDTYDQVQTIQDTLTSEKLDVDDPAVAARYKHFDDLAMQTAVDMDKSPLNYKKHSGRLRRASRELSSEMKTGVIGRAQEQFEDFNTIKEDLGKRKDLKQETKDVYQDFLLKKYGGLGYDSKTGSFNKIKDSEINLKSEILDENKFISEVGTNFEFHSKGQGGVYSGDLKGVDGKVIFTSSTNESHRSPARVKAAMESELAAKDYRGSREQFYMMQQEIGELSPLDLDENGNPMSPADLALRDEQALIERGVNKLTGKKGHRNVSVKSLSSVTGKATEQENKFNDEVVDNLGSHEIRGETAMVSDTVGTLIKSGQLQGYSSPEDIIQTSTFPSGDGRTFATNFSALNGQGLFVNDKVGYTNWLNANHKQKTLKENASTGLYNAYNTSEQNQFVNIYYRDGENKRNILPFKSASELAIHNQNTDNDIVWVKMTGTSKSETPSYSKNAKGYLISKDGVVITRTVGEGADAINVPVSDPADIPEFGLVKPHLNYKDIPSYNNASNVFKATPGTLSLSSTNQLDTLGRNSPKEELVHTNQWFAINRKTNKYTIHSVDIVSDPKRFPKSKK